MIKCGKCGNELLKTDVACSSCKTSILELKQTNNIIIEKNVVEEEGIPMNEKPIKAKSNLPKYLGILVGLVVLLVGGYFLFDTLLSNKETSENTVYSPGKVTDREIIGYLKYKTPEAWVRDDILDEEYSYEVDLFNYKDEKSTMLLRAITPFEMDPETGEYEPGVNKEQWIANLSYQLGSPDVKTVEETFEEVTWTKMYGEVTDENQNKFLNTTYMYISQDGNDVYTIEIKKYINSNEKENSELDKSIRYILDNAKPEK
jgi:hypothetical protein